jgi:predicted transglutaminase-like cysteine proteinase
VKTNITYKTEEKDFWNFPNETLASKVGDCEDGAILLANLMLACGLKYYDIMLNVVNTPLGFHVYVTYKNQIYDWTSLIHSDWKFWYCWNARNAYTTPENVELWKK